MQTHAKLTMARTVIRVFYKKTPLDHNSVPMGSFAWCFDFML